MCGIAGFLGFNDDSLLMQMTRIMAHRGPDDEGTFSETGVGLGHRRLSIIDLSRHGHQPMADPQQRAVIAYNGEIYNFAAIRTELEQMGVQLISNTDTEVVLQAYLQWGEECLSRFNGMFALAIWDRHKKELFLARDRVGIKPLYYTLKDNRFVFGSEIKAILCWDGIDRKVNSRALDYYFTFRYNHLDETLFRDVMKLPPGCCMSLRLDAAGRVSHRMSRYWDVPVGRRSQEGDLSTTLADGLRTSVDRRMLSDVPLGAFLSSGVDSSTIVAIMKQELKKTTRTFTVGFDYPGFEDELDPVRFTVNHFDTTHTEHVCQPDMASIIPRVVWHADELNADPALIPTYLISEIARQKVAVVLSGEGSDELFGGYERTAFMTYAWRTGRVSPALARAIPAVIGMVPLPILDRFFKYSSSIGSKGLDRLTQFCSHTANTGAAYLDVAATFNQAEKADLYVGPLSERLREENIAETLNEEFFPVRPKRSADLFDDLSLYELKTRLPNDLLAKVDSMTMAHSLEGRVPYLDHDLVELAFSIPPRLKLRFMREKYILRQAAQRYLPREIIKRRKDHFFVPIHLWLQNELRPTVDRILTRENIGRTGCLNPEFVLSAYENYKQGSLFYARQLWNILFFLVWHRLYIETDMFLTMSNQDISLEQLFSGD